MSDATVEIYEQIGFWWVEISHSETQESLVLSTDKDKETAIIQANSRLKQMLGELGA